MSFNPTHSMFLPSNRWPQKTDAITRNIDAHTADLSHIHKTTADNQQFLHSILNQSSQVPNLLERCAFAQKALAMFSLGNASNNSKYEGWSNQEATTIFCLLLNAVNQQSYFSKGPNARVLTLFNCFKTEQAHLRTLVSIENKAKHVMQKIRDLEIGDSYLLDGGWIAIPSGHRMLYRFERQSADTFKFYIYNAQSGSENQQGGEVMNWRMRVYPCYQMENIPLEKLFFCQSHEKGNPIILEKLIELNEDTWTMGSVEKILSFVNHLLPYRVISKQSNLFISVQRSGNCIVKALNCALLELTQNKEDYKRVNLDATFHLLQAFYHKFSQDFSNPTYGAHLFELREATQNYLRKIDHLKKTALLKEVSEETYAIVIGTCLDILDNLAQKERAQVDHIEADTGLAALYNKTNQAKTVQKRLQATIIPLTSLKAHRSISLPRLDVSLGQKATWQTFKDTIYALDQLVQKFNQNHLQETVLQIESTFRHLAHLKNSPINLSQLSEYELALLQSTLVQLQERYIQSAQSLKTASSSAVINTVFELLAFNFLIALELDTPHHFIKNYGLYTEHLKKLTTLDLFSTFSNENLSEQRQNLIQFFNRYQGEDPLFNFENQLPLNADYTNIAEGNLYYNYINADQQIENYFRTDHTRRWPELSQPLTPAECLKNNIKSALITSNSSLYLKSLNHVFCLKTSALLATSLFASISSTRSSEISIDSKNELSYCILKLTWSKDKLEFYKNSHQEYAGTDSSKEAYLKMAQSVHTYTALRNENACLAKAKLDESDDAQDSLYQLNALALAEPEVQTPLIINHMRSHLDCIQSESTRFYLQVILNKIVKKDIKGQSEQLNPFLNYFSRNLRAIKSVENLVKKSSSYFIDQSFKPQWQEFLFILQVYAKALQATDCQKMSPKSQDKTKAVIRDLVKRMDRADNETAQQTQELKFAKSALYLSTPLDFWTTEEQADLFITFAQVKNNYQPLKIFSNPLLYQECHRRFYQLDWTTKLDKDAFGNSVVHQIYPHAPKLTHHWDYKEGHLTTKTPQTKWTIDFNTLTICTTQGNCFEIQEVLPNHPDLKRLFGSTTYHLKRNGDDYVFDDAKWGFISVNYQNNNSYYIKRILDDLNPKNFIYLPPNRCTNLYLNASLIYDHAIWYDEQNPKDVRICDIKTGQELYYIKEGIVYNKQTDAIFSYDDTHPILERFESKNYIQSFVSREASENQEANGLLKFPRLCDEKQVSLAFTWNAKKKGWLYSHNTSFHIDAHFKPFFRFNLDCYLPLKDFKTKQQKILIPYSLLKLDRFTPQVNINIPDCLEDGQQNSIKYFEYDVDPTTHHLMPTCLAGKIYLISLLMAKKEHLAALTLLQTMTKSERLSPLSIEYLQKILAYKAQTPYDAALLLKIYLKLPLQEPKFSKEALIANYLLYLQGLNNIQIPFLLDKEEEFALYKLLNIEKLEKDAHGKEHLLKLRYQFLKHSKVDLPVFTIKLPQNKIPSPMIDLKQFDLAFKYNDALQDKGELSSQEIKELNHCYPLIEQDPFHQVEAFLYKIKHADNYQRLTKFVCSLIYSMRQRHLTPPALPNNLQDKAQVLRWVAAMNEVYKGQSSTQDSSLYFSSKEMIEKDPKPQPLLQTIKYDLSLLSTGHEGWLEKLREEYLVKSSKTQVDTPLNCVKWTLSQEEKNYSKGIETYHQAYEKDSKIAAEEKANRSTLAGNLASLQQKLNIEAKETQRIVQALEDKVLKLANKAPLGRMPFMQHQLTLNGRGKPALTLDEILRACTKKEPFAALRKLNSHLTEKESHILYNLSLGFMVESTHGQQLKRILNPLEKGLREDTAKALAAARCYDPSTQPFPLFIEYVSNVRIYSKQANLIQTALDTFVYKKSDSTLNKGLVFQLIMGGGKTSVILSLLLELLAEELDLVPCLVSHNSQMASARGQFAKHQGERFKKELLVLDYSISDLDDPVKLTDILEKLAEAKAKKWPLLMKNSLPPMLELKFIANTQYLIARNIDLELSKRIEQQQAILQFLKNQTLAFYDESHLNLSIQNDVILPIGESESIEPQSIDLVKNFFKILLQDPIKKLTQLDQNAQPLLSQENYEKDVLPYLTQEIFKYKPLRLRGSTHLNAFMRFLKQEILATDQIVANQLATNLDSFSIQSKENIAFLRFLTDLHTSPHPSDKKAAELISLSVNLLNDVLPLALTKYYNRNYGRSDKSESGQVIPYLATNTPATTQFGNIYLSLVYHFQSAANVPIKEEQIKFLADKMIEVAGFYAKKEQIFIDETSECKQFYRLTGVHLTEIENAGKLKQASQYVNASLDRRLDLEGELAPFNVHYYPKEIRSNAINNAEQFKHAIACSGTTWNAATYHTKFGILQADQGAEGSIFNCIIERAKEKPSLHVMPDAKLETLMKTFANHPNKSKLRAFVDGAGLLKEYTNPYIVDQFFHFFAKEEAKGGPKIKGVVYTHKFSKEEVAKGYPEEAFVLQKKGNASFYLLKSGSKEEIEQLGVKIDHLFILYDELRATGTDFPLAKDAFILNSLDHKMTSSTYLQAYLRARGVFQDQRVEFVVTQDSQAKMINQGRTLSAVHQTFIKNEALTLADQAFRSYLSKIDNVIRATVLKELMQEKDQTKLSDLSKLYAPFLVTDVLNDPYRQFGQISIEKRTIEILNQQAHLILDQFKKTNSVNYSAVSDQIALLLNQAKQDPILVEKVKCQTGSDLNTAIEVEQTQELELALEQEQEIQLTQDLQLELDQYRYEMSYPIAEEASWQLNAQLALWIQVQARLQQVKEWANRPYTSQAGKKVSTSHYTSLFPDNLWVTDNFYFTHTVDAPFLHPSTKYASFVLSIKNPQGNWQFILVSEKDAVFFGKWLAENPQAEGYLVDLTNQVQANCALVKKQGQDPTFQEEHFKGLFFANLFDGNIPFLEEHYDKALPYFRSQEKLIARFLCLKTRRFKVQSRKFYTSHFAKKLDYQFYEKTQGVLFSDRRAPIDVSSLDEVAIANMNAYDTHLLNENQVKRLPAQLVNAISIQQVAFLTDKQLQFLTNPALISQITVSQLPLLKEDQFKYLNRLDLVQAAYHHKIDSISPHQVSFLSDEQIKRLKNRDLIYALPKEKFVYLQDAQLPFIKPTCENLDAIPPNRWRHLTSQQINEAYALEHKGHRYKLIGALHALALIPKLLFWTTLNAVSLIMQLPPLIFASRRVRWKNQLRNTVVDYPIQLVVSASLAFNYTLHKRLAKIYCKKSYF